MLLQKSLGRWKQVARQDDNAVKFRQQLVDRMLLCKQKPSEFARHILQYEPFDYNSLYLDCMNQWVVYRSGRKVGKTKSTAAKTLHFAWFAPFMMNQVKPDCEIIMVAPTQAQADIIIGMAKSMAENSPILSQYIVKTVAHQIWIRYVTGNGITKIYTKAAGQKGDSVRGYVPDVIVADEASRLRRDVLAALIPSGFATNARVWMASTPFVKNGYFFEACKSAVAGSNNLKNTIWDKPEGKWVQFQANSLMSPLIQQNKSMAEEVKRLAKDSYKIDVLGEFLETGDALIPEELIMESIGEYKMPEIYDLYLGVDPARLGSDETVYTIVAVDEKRDAYVVETYSKEDTLTTEIVVDIKGYFNKYGSRLKMCYCDETGLGAGVVDMARVESVPIQGLVMSQMGKERIYNTLTGLFDNHRIHLGIDQPRLQYQLAYLQKKYAGAHMSIVSEEHDDYPDSLALACMDLEERDSWRMYDGKCKLFE